MCVLLLNNHHHQMFVLSISTHRYLPKCPDPPVTLADPSSVVKAVECLRSAKKPLVIVGKGDNWLIHIFAHNLHHSATIGQIFEKINIVSWILKILPQFAKIKKMWNEILYGHTWYSFVKKDSFLWSFLKYKSHEMSYNGQNDTYVVENWWSRD